MSFPSAFSRYMNDDTAQYVWDLIERLNVKMKIVNPRKTKLGDCSYIRGDKKSVITITVNGDLEKFQFLITLVHELAHAKTNRMYSHRLQPHGVEWKSNFKALFQPIISEKYLEEDEIQILKKILINPKASSCDPILIEFLKKKNGNTSTLLKYLNVGDYFSLDSVKYVINEKLRTRYLCTRLHNKRKYRVHGLAEVEPLSSEDEYIAPRLIKKTLVSELAEGDTFRINNMLFVRGRKLRTRYECFEKGTNKEYVIPGKAPIELIK